MKFNSLLQSNIFIYSIICLLMMNSCDVFNEDLPECRLSVKFKYDYNMRSTDEFHTQVDKVTLYVFGEDDKFLFQQSAEGSLLESGDYQMELDLPVGHYKLMAWAGVHDSYEIPPLQEGVSTITDLKLRLKRDETLIIDKKLEPLWYGEIMDVNYTGEARQAAIINLIKNTKKIRCVFQVPSNGDDTLLLEDYKFEIKASNGYLNYDNSLLEDDLLSYRPYYVEQKSSSIMIVELNTLRLLANHEAYFTITEKATGKTLLNINLIDFFSLVEMEGNKWGEQEYLDRQSEYVIAFLLKDPSSAWIAAQITINGWTLYSDEEDI